MDATTPICDQAATAPHRRRARPPVIVFLAVVVAVLGTVTWLRLRPTTAETCVGVGTTGPAANSPEAAVAAWWAQHDPEEVERWIDRASSPAQMPEHPEFAPLYERRWEWRYRDNASLEVDVMPAGAGAWAVDGVGGCTDA
jgi:hypothetical protein